MLKNRKGFTLAELLIVVAIIGVLVAIAIPVFTSQLEKSREATDLANVRAAYAEVMADANLGITNTKIRVQLKQKQDGWSGRDTVTIGGITHSASGYENTPNWKGNARAKGVCEISFREATGILFDWKGYNFNTDEDLFSALTSSGQLSGISSNTNFEFDSRCPNSQYIPNIKEKIADDSLLKGGTWAYLGSAKEQDKAKRYFFWTSLNTDKIGAGKPIPVIIQTGDGKFYVSETITGQRTDSKGKKYVAVSQRIGNDNGYQQILKNGTKCDSLIAAYDLYEENLAADKYKNYPREDDNDSGASSNGSNANS